jgi:hydroxymethylglutaryl-CoA lyase
MSKPAGSVQIIECPRDAWQGLHGQIPSSVKAAYLRALIKAGFQKIDAVSFVSPAAVPQMADSEVVLKLLDAPKTVEIIGIVVNERGAERAIECGRVQTLGFPFSVSAEFLKRNQRQTPKESLAVLEAVANRAAKAGLNLVGYLSMAFGNPYDDAWSEAEVVRACEALMGIGVKEISLADTVGVATPKVIGKTVKAVLSACGKAEVGVHLHARREEAEAKIRAAYDAGCRRFDSALGGLGGCPFAQDGLVGNLPTEILLAVLADCGAKFKKLGPLDALLNESAEIGVEYGG